MSFPLSASSSSTLHSLCRGVHIRLALYTKLLYKDVGVPSPLDIFRRSQFLPSPKIADTECPDEITPIRVLGKDLRRFAGVYLSTLGVSLTGIEIS
ncbi:hypothetical protein PGTUg99_007931 [Puccinia graminis f. sp. tritici]|uniref:Uncharacterized protein n=1 Tax=Puccinia graminis f. sp. tritici TaxID=56615 RepID=A0A5B0N8K8_PUCGR|nr:hypothetical protein PGTUg99_007931 [Puccinia graminis f. sp. tritici]